MKFNNANIIALLLICKSLTFILELFKKNPDESGFPFLKY